MNGARPSSLDVLWQPLHAWGGDAPVMMWRAIEMWLAIEWAEAKDRGGQIWRRGALDALLEVHRMRITRGILTPNQICNLGAWQ